MAVIPSFLLRHTVIIEPYHGNTAYGPKYGLPVTVPCFIDDTRRRVRNEAGDEVVSESTVYCGLDTVAPAKSRITVNARITEVIMSKRRDGGGLPTPDHLEVVLR